MDAYKDAIRELVVSPFRFFQVVGVKEFIITSSSQREGGARMQWSVIRM